MLKCGVGSGSGQRYRYRICHKLSGSTTLMDWIGTLMDSVYSHKHTWLCPSGINQSSEKSVSQLVLTDMMFKRRDGRECGGLQSFLSFLGSRDRFLSWGTLRFIDVIVFFFSANRSVVRKFPGHDAEVTDLTFSADSRWLVTASLDSTCRFVSEETSELVLFTQL